MPARVTNLNLKSLRSAAGLTQSELAQKSGVSYQTVQAIEHGRTTAPRIATAAKLADALGVTLDALVNEAAS